MHYIAKLPSDKIFLIQKFKSIFTVKVSDFKMVIAFYLGCNVGVTVSYNRAGTTGGTRQHLWVPWLSSMAGGIFLLGLEHTSRQYSGTWTWYDVIVMSWYDVIWSLASTCKKFWKRDQVLTPNFSGGLGTRLVLIYFQLSCFFALKESGSCNYRPYIRICFFL